MVSYYQYNSLPTTTNSRDDTNPVPPCVHLLRGDLRWKIRWMHHLLLWDRSPWRRHIFYLEKKYNFNLVALHNNIEY